MSDVAAPDLGGWDALVKRASGHMTETESMVDSGSRRTQRAIAERLLTDKPPPAPESPPPPQPMAPQQQRSPMETFGGAASVLGILGGLLSRAPLTASLKAATGAMNGYRQRDLETYQQNIAQWKAQSEYAERLSEWQQNRYKAAYDQYKDNHDALIGAWRMLASQDGNDIARKAAETGDMRVIEEALKFQADALNKYRESRQHADTLAETHRHNLENEAIGHERAQIIMGKGTQKVDEQVKELNFLKDDVGSLYDRVSADPSLVGAKGMFRRGIQAVTGQLESQNERDKQAAQDKAAVKFKSDMVALQARLMPLIHARYFSGPAAAMAEKLVEGLNRFDDPEAAKASLETLNRLLEQDIATKTQTSKAVNQNLKDLSNEDLLKHLGIQ